MNNKSRKTSHITNIIQFDAEGHVVIPASLTLGIAPGSDDNSAKVPSTAWVRGIITTAGGAYVPTGRTLTINGVSYDLSSNRSWSIDTGVLSATAGSGISVSTVSGNLNIVNTGLLSGTAGAGISVTTVNQNLNIVNTGLLSATSGAGISVTTVNQNLNIVNTGLLSATSGSGISVTTVDQNLNIVNTGLLTATSGAGISVTTVGQNLNIVNTGILTATAGAGISISVVGQNLNIVNTITDNNQLANGAGYATTSYVTTQINNLVAGAPGLLDTLDELAQALGDDPNFATTVSTALGNRLRIDINTQGLTSTQQGNGRTNLGLGALAVLSSIGDSYITDLAYSKLTGVPSTFTPSAHTHDDRYYTETEIANFFSGASVISGYNKSNWDTAYGWGNHASAGYLTTASAASTYVSLTGSYANPAWITSLAWSKITGAPAFLTSYTETDTLASVTGRGNTTTSNINVTSGSSYIRVSGISSTNYIELSGNLPGYSNGVYPVIKSNTTIHFANNDKYAAYLEGANTYFGILNSVGTTRVFLNTSGNSYFTGGNLGVGESSPGYGLHVNMNQNQVAAFQSPNANTWIDLISTVGTWSMGATSGNTWAIYQRGGVNQTRFEVGASSASLYGNTVLHAGNYTSYSPSLTGSGASGTWGISITGNSATVGGYAPNQTGGAYTIVQRDANGYIQNSYFYTSGGGTERNSSGLGYIAGFNSSDYYIRSYNSTAVASFLGLGSMAYASTGSYALVNGNTSNSFGVLEINYASTAFNPSTGPRTNISSMSVKMWNNYFNGTGLGSDYGTVMQYYSLGGHVDSQVYFDAAGGSWYRTASYNSGYGSWQKYVTENGGSWSISVTGSAGSATSASYLTGGDSAAYLLLYNALSGDLNGYNSPGLYSAEYTGSTNRPIAQNGSFIQISDAGGTDVKTQWYYSSDGANIYMRLQWGNGSWRSWRTLITDSNISSQSVSYASSAGNADTLDGYHGSNYLGFNGNSYYQASNWIQFNTTNGLYWPSYNGAHLYANDGSYGSIKILGSRNGWHGIEFGNAMNLMANTNESGFHNNNYGWQFRWNNGTLYCYKNSYGGGTAATVLDSSNATYAWNMNQYVRTSDGPTFSGLTINGTTTLNGNVNIDRHIDADTTWGNCGCTSLFLGWSTSKIIIGNNASGAHDWANDRSANSIVSTVNHFFYNNIYAREDIVAYWSDVRLKDNIRPIEGALEKISKIGGYYYTPSQLAVDLNATEDMSERVGVMAQEIEEVLPHVVKPAPFNNEYKTVQYEKIVPLLIEAIKEQQQQIEELKNKLDGLTK